jgi:hypothetical protein
VVEPPRTQHKNGVYVLFRRKPVQLAAKINQIGLSRDVAYVLKRGAVQ